MVHYFLKWTRSNVTECRGNAMMRPGNGVTHPTMRRNNSIREVMRVTCCTSRGYDVQVDNRMTGEASRPRSARPVRCVAIEGAIVNFLCYFTSGGQKCVREESAQCRWHRPGPSAIRSIRPFIIPLPYFFSFFSFLSPLLTYSTIVHRFKTQRALCPTPAIRVLQYRTESTSLRASIAV